MSSYYCDDRTVVRIDAGSLRGGCKDGVFTFRGIPYAKAKRFQMPEPPEPWEGIRNAVTYGHVAPTVDKPNVTGLNCLMHQPLFGYRFWPENEACQYLNVWTKDISGTGPKKPVMFWIHGGGFCTGSSVEQQSFEGENLARTGDVVVVSINHRLNVLGFLNMSEFSEKYANSGNAGIADIVEALRWVKRNIAVFGGDPDNVTLFGHSGGGKKIRTLLQIPEADDLYCRCIIQSGLMESRYWHEATTPEDGLALARAMVKHLGLTKETIEAIETVDFEQLRRAYFAACKEISPDPRVGLAALSPVPNDYYLGDPVMVGFTEKAKRTPVIAGTVSCEDILMSTELVPRDLPEAECLPLLQKKFGDGAAEMIDLYRKAYPGKRLTDLYNMDYSFRHGNVLFLDAAVQAGMRVYSYQLTYNFGYLNGLPSFHGACLPLVFNNAELVDAYCEPGAMALAEKVSAAWAQFAYSGAPAAEGLPEWKPYEAGSFETMILDTTCEMRPDFDRTLLAAYKRITGYRGQYEA